MDIKKPNPNLVLIILSVITLMCVGALIYEVLWSSHEGALNTMSNVAMIGVGALASQLGYRTSTRQDD